MYNIMTKLINKRFYKTREEAQQKCDVFYAVGRITDEQYTDLCALIESVYGETEAKQETTAQTNTRGNGAAGKAEWGCAGGEHRLQSHFVLHKQDRRIDAGKEEQYGFCIFGHCKCGGDHRRVLPHRHGC